jgi:hypothetical protein
LKNNIDPLFHFLFLDLRFSGELNLYKPFKVDRDPVEHSSRPSQSRLIDIEDIKLDLNIDEKQKSLVGKATITFRPFLNDLTQKKFQ